MVDTSKTPEKKVGMSSTAMLSVPTSRIQAKHFSESEILLQADTGIIGHARVFDWLRVPFEGKDKNGNKVVNIFDIIDSLHCTRVLIVVTDQHGVHRLVLVEQDRQKVIDEQATPQTWGKRVIELPGGAIEREVSTTGQIKEENVIVNSLKEAFQEAGVVAKTAVPLYQGNPNGNVKDAGFGPGKVYWYKITGTATVGENDPEPEEGKVRVLFRTLPEALKMIETGEINDALTIVPILEYARQKQAQELETQRKFLRAGHRPSGARL